MMKRKMDEDKSPSPRDGVQVVDDEPDAETQSRKDMTEDTPDFFFWFPKERKPSKNLQHYSDWVLGHHTMDFVH